MTTKLKRIALFICFILIYPLAFSQPQYTPYDDLPGVIKSYKPSYNESFPDWAKKMYEYPVNLKEVEKDFQIYMSENPGKKSPIIRYYKIWRKVVSPYTSINGDIILPDVEGIQKELYLEQRATKKKAVSVSNNNADWTFLGPKETYWLNESNSSSAPKSCPWQVNVYSFDVSSSDDNILYCGTETGLMNKTTDKGQTWQQIAKNYPFGGGVTAVQIHPTDPDIVYVAAGSQIHKTIDGGLSWTPMLSSDKRFGANRLKLDPSNPHRIIAAANEGIYITNDAGSNWTKKTSFRTWDVDINPGNSNIIYGLYTNGAGNFMLSLSVDGGLSFSAVSFPSDIPDASGGLIAVSPAKPNQLFCVMLSSDNDNTPYLYKGAYVESTSSVGWIKLATGKTSKLEMNNGQGYFDLVLEVSPDDEDLIMVGTTTFFKSTDGGYNFTVVGGYWGDFSIHPDIQDLKMLPGNITWVATDGGLSYTTDNFVSTSNYYSKNNGIVGSDMWGFDQGWNEDIIVGGRYHNGNTALADFYGDKALRMGGAESPTGWVIHGKSRHVAFNDLGNGWILPKTAEGPPEGRFIFSKYPNMVEYGGRRGNLLHHPRYYEIIYVGEGNGFWVSSDMGQSFDLYHTFPNDVRYMEISFRNPEVIFADVVGYGLYKTVDGGETWERKPSLTSGDYGNSSWNGKLFFALSPTNSNILYACLSNGAWSSDIGKVFKSTDGGDSWTDITGSISEYLKSIVIQPDENGQDLLYLFSTNKGYTSSKVYYRTSAMNDWAEYNTGYPTGMSVNRAMPFFRDGKLRVGGSASVWESPLEVQDFYPIINPWVGKAMYNCCEDTLRFDDHSMLKHEGANWTWTITPEPEYISDKNARNPKVVLGEPGSYNVKLEVTQNGKTYSKTVMNMVTTTSCPSLNDCSNPAEIPTDDWKVIYVDSEETPYGRYAENAFDGDIETFWHTAWSQSSPTHPHELQVDMDSLYQVSVFTIQQRTSSENGRIADYQLYITDSLPEWGDPVSTGTFENSVAPQVITFTEPVKGRYFKLIALSEVNDNAWASVAEISMNGCYVKTIEDTTSIRTETEKYLRAFPVPASNLISIDLPGNDQYKYSVYSSNGKLMDAGLTPLGEEKLDLKLLDYSAGIYLVNLQNARGTMFRVKFVKK